MRSAVNSANVTPSGPHTVSFALPTADTVNVLAGTLPIRASQTFSTGADLTVSGNPLSLGQGVQLGLNVANGALLTIQNNIVSSGWDRGILVSATLTSISGPFGRTGIVELNGHESYTGPTTLAPQANLVVGPTGSLPVGTMVVFQGGPNAPANNFSPNALYFETGSQSIGSVQGRGGLIQIGPTLDIGLPSPTLTIGATGADSHFGGILGGIAGSELFIKAGSGTFYFTGRGIGLNLDVRGGIFQLDGIAQGTLSASAGGTIAGSGFSTATRSVAGRPSSRATSDPRSRPGNGLISRQPVSTHPSEGDPRSA